MSQKPFNSDGRLYVKYDDKLKNKGFELKYAKAQDVGMDLPAIMSESLKIKPEREYHINREECWFDIPSGGLAEVPCGISIKVPDDAWANIKPRSSTAWKRGLIVHEAVIDSGYTGPLFILVRNPLHEPVRVHEWDRLAQLIIVPKYHVHGGYVDASKSINSLFTTGVTIEATDDLPATERGSTGFGSSGGLRENQPSDG